MEQTNEIRKMPYRCRKASCLINGENNDNLLYGNDKDWLYIKDCIINICNENNENEYFQKMALAIGKYHYYTAPENWEEKYIEEAEDEVYRLCDTIRNELDSYKETIDKLINEYDQNLIPDAHILYYKFIDYY